MRENWINAPFGLDVLTLAKQLEDHQKDSERKAVSALYIARDGPRMEAAAALHRFFYPRHQILTFPAWDCLPYDRTSPHPAILSTRLSTLAQLHTRQQNSNPPENPLVIYTSVAAAGQKLPPPDWLSGLAHHFTIGHRFDSTAFTSHLVESGYLRTATVREPGDYAVRGSILDIFPPGAEQPVRLDLFGDEIERIRTFDPADQLSRDQMDHFSLIPINEFTFSDPALERFRKGYRDLFGGATDHDSIFHAASERRRIPGLEHWLPLFHERMVDLGDYLTGLKITLLDNGGRVAIADRLKMIEDHYQARLAALPDKPGARNREEDFYHPLPPDFHYLDEKHWECLLTGSKRIEVSPFSAPDSSPQDINSALKDLKGHQAEQALALPALSLKTSDSAPSMRARRLAAFEHLLENDMRPILIAAHSTGARERLNILLQEKDIVTRNLSEASDFIAPVTKPEVSKTTGLVGMAVVPFAKGFAAPDLVFLGEEDLLGERLSRPPPRRRRGNEFLSELTALSPGDLVVHIDHGIGRFDGLSRIEVGDAPHDCLRLVYADDDRLYLPVENLELLSRFGASGVEAELDRLGAAAWQSRKARSKDRIKDIAEKLIRMAAERTLRAGEIATRPDGLWDQFCAGFGFNETDDQLQAIEDLASDLSSGRSMDRLICGDVGYGKTEVALRAAFLVAMSGKQVAVLTPTTLLARQHYQTFKDRFEDTGLEIGALSRLVPTAQQKQTRQSLAEGRIDIVIGTHGLLSKSLSFKNLGLVIIDEEQHFGVRQKERLKELAGNVHILSMTATPIPRTLQMALNGVRDLSIIATPPVDRMAVRSFVLPYDQLMLKEAIRRERYRGGQIFYVTPRIADIDDLYQRIKNHLAPDARLAVAHGQMPPQELEQIMGDFIAGRYDILLSTNIVESGLDIPNANTMIVHRADRFGLAQLYQLRGRVGRGKLRAYCYFVYDKRRLLGQVATRRLEAMQRLEGLGAGFTLASHDLDIRGAGNLLGDEQSGHIREIGVELYQRMLEEAIAMLRHEQKDGAPETIPDQWSPVISLGLPVMLPEDYIPDLPVRMGFYRRLADVTNKPEIDQFLAELMDRFGPPPEATRTLLAVMRIKIDCKQAGVERLEAGPKGALINFRGNRFARPEKLVEYIGKLAPAAKLRPDHRLAITRDWKDKARRLDGAGRLASALAKMASTRINGTK